MQLPKMCIIIIIAGLLLGWLWWQISVPQHSLPDHPAANHSVTKMEQHSEPLAIVFFNTHTRTKKNIAS